MIEFKLTLINKLGLHARATNKLIEVNNRFSSHIEIEFNEKRVDGKSIMSVMLLAAPFGSELTFFVDGSDESQAKEAITKLIEDYFGEGG